MQDNLSLNSVLQKANEMFINTGNIVTWQNLTKRLKQKPVDEVIDCLTHCYEEWRKNVIVNDLMYTDKLCVVLKDNTNIVNSAERSNYKITVKIFLRQVNTDLLEDAIDVVLKQLQVANIETILLALPSDLATLDNIKFLWRKLEKFVDDNQVFTIGFSDLDVEELQNLYETAEVKPSVNQVNLESCCIMPPDMIQFAKEKDITLLTHNDPQDIITENNLRKVFQNKNNDDDSNEVDGYENMTDWQPLYTVRYSILIKSRGIIHGKGYFLKAVRGIKSLKS